ncbi:hypothetical protein G6O69_02355 [Pseudenhygromyxa sp. WMMC2535]|uniref:glycine-rich protein n=1 Tax=Pseudenhygromyxa sp. WMMC2535 TaxID=2712867 RepID=UPI0015519FBF|nr:glycine-rich protein [Pseudenhygromyxa sp. WMMC2535]NVB36656.1 hypothetical protein [Pseudenhygromyxa sp. WMMC2535]
MNFGKASLLFGALSSCTLLACSDDSSTRDDDIGDPETGTDSGTDTTADTETSSEGTDTDSESSDTDSDTDSDVGTDTDTDSEGETTEGDPCETDMSGPVITSSLEPLSVPFGQSSIMYTLSFDEIVNLGEVALSVDNGASISAPSLPAQGMEFEVVIDDVDASQDYTLSLAAAEVFDTCGNALEADTQLSIAGDCVAPSLPQIVSQDFVQLDGGTTVTVVEVEFDQAIELSMDNLSVSNGAVIDTVDPALPASSESFTITLSGLQDVHELGFAGLSDGCGTDGEASFWVCTGNEVVFDYTGSEQSFEIPACTQGQVVVEAFGAEGVDALNDDGGVGGLGGQAIGDLLVETGDTLYIYVGGQDGFNGGGDPGAGNVNTSGNGGGASDVRLNSILIGDRAIVAGGGGGGSGDALGSCAADGSGGDGGAGGGSIGEVGTDGSGCGTKISTGGGGGTQNAGGGQGIGATNCALQAGDGDAGEFGQGGAGGDAHDCSGGFMGAGGGGGGGGYYGGAGGGGGPGGGGGSWAGGGGGGGSSYVDGVDDGSTSEGVNAGDGQVIISW